MGVKTYTIYVPDEEVEILERRAGRRRISAEKLIGEYVHIKTQPRKRTGLMELIKQPRKRFGYADLNPQARADLDESLADAKAGRVNSGSIDDAIERASRNG